MLCKQIVESLEIFTAKHYMFQKNYMFQDLSNRSVKFLIRLRRIPARLVAYSVADTRTHHSSRHKTGETTNRFLPKSLSFIVIRSYTLRLEPTKDSSSIYLYLATLSSSTTKATVHHSRCPPPTMTSEPWPPANGLTTQIVPRENVIQPTSASLGISAPASVVWSILLNTSTYPAWNSFCPKVLIHSQPPGISKTDPILHLDTSFTFNVVMDSKKPDKVTPTQLRIKDISSPDAPSSYIPQDVLDAEPTYSADLSKVYRISWTTEGGFVARGLRTERFHEIIPTGEAECEVRTWECQGGVLARAVKFAYAKVLKEKFMEWCEDLKKASEARHRASES